MSAGSKQSRLLATIGNRNKRFIVIGIPYFWLLLFFFIPFIVVFKISISESTIAQPPFTPLFSRLGDNLYQIKINLSNYVYVLTDSYYVMAFLNSIKLAFISTILCLLVAYPIAFTIARSRQPWQNVLLMMIMLPFWTSFLLRVYAWIGLLQSDGLITNTLNQALLAIGAIDSSLTILQTNTAIYLGIVYSYLPFMVLPLYTTLEKLDDSLFEASADLGARPVRTFLSVILPLTKSGIVAGCLLVFIPAVGEFVIPYLLGGADSFMIGRVLWDEFFKNNDWPMASTLAVIMLAILLIPMLIFRKSENKEMLV